MVELYYNEDLSLAEIAVHSGITRQGVRDSIKRAEAQLIEYEEHLKLVERFRHIQEAIGKISSEAQGICDFNKRFGSDNTINHSAQKIIELANEVIDEV